MMFRTTPHFFQLSSFPSDYTEMNSSFLSLHFCQQAHSECQFWFTSAVLHACVRSIHATESFGLCCLQSDLLFNPQLQIQQFGRVVPLDVQKCLQFSPQNSVSSQLSFEDVILIQYWLSSLFKNSSHQSLV